MLPFVSICDSSNSLRLPIWCIPVLLTINSQRGNKFGNKGNSSSRFLTVNQKIFRCTRKTAGFGTEGHRSQFSVAFPQCCLPVRERTQLQALLLGVTNRDCPGVRLEPWCCTGVKIHNLGLKLLPVAFWQISTHHCCFLTGLSRKLRSLSRCIFTRISPTLKTKKSHTLCPYESAVMVNGNTCR